MTEYEYAELMSFFKSKLKRHPETGLSGNRAEGYEKGIQAAMSKVNAMYKSPRNRKVFVLVSPGNVSYPFGVKGCSNSRDAAYDEAENLKAKGEGPVQVIKSKFL